ncbi:MAG: hypothetical protein QM500_13245, partial [Methylococcales bacterium]
MRDDQTVIINTPLAFNCQTPLQHQIRLVRYTAQLRALLDSPPVICEQCSIDALESDVLDNYLWAVGELINGMFQLKNRIQREQQDFINK